MTIGDGGSVEEEMVDSFENGSRHKGLEGLGKKAPLRGGPRVESRSNCTVQAVNRRREVCKHIY
jgi:hypothetical protein